jgi:prepilin-type processing-associated H-X9-DG protein
MYVADNDGRFPPHQTPVEPHECQWGADNSNPWLRWPVVLEPYVADRSVYLCPAMAEPRIGYTVLTHPNWITSERISTRGWPDGPCGSVWPPGWGGAITDSATQGRCADPERFTASVGAAVGALNGRRLNDVEESAKHVMWADSARFWVNLGSIVYANACRVDCADLKGQADWDNCPWSQQCGAGGDFASNPEVHATFTRHEGGSNIAFVDGHVEWISALDIIKAYKEKRLVGVSPADAAKGQPWYVK